MKTTRQILSDARDLIAGDETWTRGDFAAVQRFANGRRTYYQPEPIDSPAATCFCSLGAIYRAAETTTSYPSNAAQRACAALARVVDTSGWTPPAGDAPHVIVAWNDRPQTKHDDVLAAFDRAIVLADEIR